MNKLLKHIFFTLCLFLVIFSGELIYAAPPFRIHSLLVFGDGGTDNGNTYHQYGFPVMPPYWRGRFCNGPVGAEYLAHKLNLIADPLQHPNYNRRKLFVDISYFNAVVLAQNATSISAPPYSPPTFTEEVNQYLSSSPHNYPGSTLVMIAVGSNDSAAPACLANPLSCLQGVVSTMIDQIELLCKKGFTHFFLILPVSADTKPGLAYLFHSPQAVQTYNVLTGNYLQEFSNIKVQVENDYPQAHVALFKTIEVDNAVIKVFSIPVSFPCYRNPNAIYNHQVGPVCDNPDQHVYFDSYFYSRKSHQLFADAVYKELKQLNWVGGRTAPHWWQRI